MKTSVSHVEQQAMSAVETIFFPEGIIGFPEYKQYAIAAEKSREPFFWLQAVENPETAFIVINPREIDPCYTPLLTSADKEMLQVSGVEQCSMLAIVVVPKDSTRISVNLLAPLLINTSVNIGRQVILQEQDYAIQHFLFADTIKEEGQDVSSIAKTK